MQGRKCTLGEVLEYLQYNVICVFLKTSSVKIDHFGLATRWSSTSLQQKMQSLFSIKKKVNLAFEGGLDGGHLPGGDRYALWVEQGVTLKSGTAASYCFSTRIREIRCCLRSASVNSSFYLCAFQLGYTSDSWTEGRARGKVEVLSCTWKVSHLQHKFLSCNFIIWTPISTNLKHF